MQVAIVAGSAECLWDDIARLKEVYKDYAVYCVNDTALYYPGNIRGCISIHAEMFTPWFKGIVHQKGGLTVSSRQGADVSYNPSPEPLDSGLLATRYVNMLGFDLVVLCGIPLDKSRKFYEPYSASSNVWQDNIVEAWKEQAHFLTKVRSMSGKTKELLGGLNGI